MYQNVYETCVNYFVQPAFVTKSSIDTRLGRLSFQFLRFQSPRESFSKAPDAASSSPCLIEAKIFFVIFIGYVVRLWIYILGILIFHILTYVHQHESAASLTSNKSVGGGYKIFFFV